MSFQWATRACILRHLRLGNAFSRPTRVISAQNQLRRVCHATKPQLRIPSTAFKPVLLSRQSHGFATAAGSAKSKPKKKLGRPKSKTTKSNKPKQKPGRKKSPEKVAAEQQRAKIQALKATALEEPTMLPPSSWSLAVAAKAAELKGKFPLPQQVLVEAVKVAKNMSPEELAPYKTQAEENKTANEAAYKSWVESFTPLQIRDANFARRALARLEKGKKRRQIKDDRQVKMPKSPFFIFVTQRMATGDFKHVRVSESVSRITQEWKSMNETEKQPYHELHERERERYAREHMEVYGVAPKTYEGENAPGAKAAE